MRLQERSHSKDGYECLFADIFVDGQHLAEFLSQERRATLWRSTTHIHHLRRGQSCQFNFIFETVILIGI